MDFFLQTDVPPETRKKLNDYVTATKSQSYPVYWSDQRKAKHRVVSVCHLVLALPEFQLD